MMTMCLFDRSSGRSRTGFSVGVPWCSRITGLYARLAPCCPAALYRPGSVSPRGSAARAQARLDRPLIVYLRSAGPRLGGSSESGTPPVVVTLGAARRCPSPSTGPFSRWLPSLPAAAPTGAKRIRICWGFHPVPPSFARRCRQDATLPDEPCR